ncbi:MAG TPA: hypothetical protein VIS96_04790 [Terrimicrobiaceae bacterium]
MNNFGNGISQISPRPAPAVFVFDFHRRVRDGRISLMDAIPGLDAGLLIGRKDELIIGKDASLPGSLVEIKNASGFLFKERVSRKKPATMLPGANGIFMEPAPYRGFADARDQSALDGMGSQLRGAPTRQWHTGTFGPLAGQRFDAHDHIRGKKPGDVPGGWHLPDPAGVLQRNVFSIN